MYNPAVAYTSTNNAVDFTWNFRLLRNSDSNLFRTFYRAYLSQCPTLGICMGQWETRDDAFDLMTWDEILRKYYYNSWINAVWNPPGGWSLRYYGNGYGDLDRVKIPIDNPSNSNPGPPADVGAEDFTIEWWMKVPAGANNAPSVTCGANADWVYGNTLLDRDRFNQGRKFGISLAGNRLVFGVSGDGTGDLTICGTSRVDDSQWHHVAVQRRASDGWMWLFVDGRLEAEGDGPDGDVSYPDDGVPGSYCGSTGDQPCTSSDPFLVIGAEKHDTNRTTFPSYSGWLDELRLSNSLRYAADFTIPTGPFTTDANTKALYHFNEGFGNVLNDASGYSGSPGQVGDRNYGGATNGPEWTSDSPWFVPQPTPTPWGTPTRTPTPNDHTDANSVLRLHPHATPDFGHALRRDRRLRPGQHRRGRCRFPGPWVESGLHIDHR